MPEDSPSLIALFVRPLNALGISYLVTGGVASIVYGEPRLTRDIDLVIHFQAGDAARMLAEWPPDRFYVPPLEVLQEESTRARHGHFNILHHDSGLRADIYVAGQDELTAWAMLRPHVERAGPDVIRLAPIAYVVLMKLRYFQQGGSARHLEDIEGMLRIRGDLVDRPELEDWVRRLGLEEEWERVRDAL